MKVRERESLDNARHNGIVATRVSEIGRQKEWCGRAET